MNRRSTLQFLFRRSRSLVRPSRYLLCDLTILARTMSGLFRLPNGHFNERQPTFQRPSNVIACHYCFRTIFLRHKLRTFRASFRFHGPFQKANPISGYKTYTFRKRHLRFLLSPFGTSMSTFRVVFLFRLSGFFIVRVIRGILPFLHFFFLHEHSTSFSSSINTASNVGAPPMPIASAELSVARP